MFKVCFVSDSWVSIKVYFKYQVCYWRPICGKNVTIFSLHFEKFHFRPKGKTFLCLFVFPRNNLYLTFFFATNWVLIRNSIFETDFRFQCTRMMVSFLNYGCPMKPFFIEIQIFWPCADKLGGKILGHLWYFWQNNQHKIWYSKSLVHVFHYSTIISTKKLSHYIHMPNINFGLGFEFGPQRIRDLAIVCS